MSSTLLHTCKGRLCDLVHCCGSFLTTAYHNYLLSINGDYLFTLHISTETFPFQLLSNSMKAVEPHCFIHNCK